jgi:Tfp pilus assembly protein PilE
MSIQMHAVPGQPGAGSVGVRSDGQSSRSDVSATAVSNFDRTAFTAAVGVHNTERYLTKFERFHRGGWTWTWHWPAFFVTLPWLLYRKQWMNAFGYFAASAIAQAATMVAVAFEPSLGGAAPLALLLLIFIGPALLADKLYYRQCRRLVAQARAGAGSRDEQIGMLKGKGGTSQVALLIAAGLLLVAVLGVLSGIALPAYQSYTARAKASEALVAARKATANVDVYYETHQRFPGTLADAGFTAAFPAHVTGLNINPASGVVTVEVVLSASDNASKHILLTPSVRGDQSIAWSCHSPDLEPSVLPLACRQSAP